MNTAALTTTAASVTSSATHPVNRAPSAPALPPSADRIVVARTAMPAVPMSSRLRRRAFTGLGRRLRGTDQRDVHRVLQRLRDAEGAVQRDQAADDDGRAAALETLRVAQLVADDRELAQRRVEDPLLQVRVVLQHEAEHRRQQEQQREERQKAVERDQRGQVRTLVLEELVDHRNGEPGPTVSPLVPVKPLRHPHAGAPRYRFSARSPGSDPAGCVPNDGWPDLIVTPPIPAGGRAGAWRSARSWTPPLG